MIALEEAREYHLENRVQSITQTPFDILVMKYERAIVEERERVIKICANKTFNGQWCDEVDCDTEKCDIVELQKECWERKMIKACEEK